MCGRVFRPTNGGCQPKKMPMTINFDSGSTVAQRIRFLMSSLGAKSERKFAEITGIPRHKIRYAIDSNSLTPELAGMLVESTGCSPKWLILGEGDPFEKNRLDISGAWAIDSEVALLEGARPTPSEIELESLLFVPKLRPDLIIHGAKALGTAGNTEWFAFPKRMIEAKAASPASVRVLSVQDDFMFDMLKKDDLVLADTSKKEITNGKIYAIVFGQSFYISEARFYPESNRILLIPRNPVYSNFDVNADAARIIGELFWYGRLLS